MERFHIIPDADVIIVTRSVFKQAKVYRRGDALYVGTSGGFVRLYAGGSTGIPALRWDDIDIPGLSRAEIVADALGKLSAPTGKLIEAK